MAKRKSVRGGLLKGGAAAAAALDNLNERNEKSDSREAPYVPIEVAKIFREHNPRRIPFDLDTMRGIEWPSLDLDYDDACQEISVILDEHSRLLDVAMDNFTRDGIIDFLGGTHTLAQSLSVEVIHPINVYTEDHFSDRYYLISGERRAIACIYGGIKLIYANVFPTRPDDGKIAWIADQENTETRRLTLEEMLLSKRNLFMRCADRDSINTKNAAKFFSLPRSTAHRYLTIVRSHMFDTLMEELRAGKVKPNTQALAEPIAELEGRVSRETRNPKASPQKKKSPYLGGISFDLVNPSPAVKTMISHLARYDGLPKALSKELASADTPDAIASAWAAFSKHLDDSKDSK